MDERLRIALQTTITRFEGLRQFGKTQVPCGLCKLHFNKACMECPLTRANKTTDPFMLSCMDMVMGGMRGDTTSCFIMFGIDEANFLPTKNYIQVNNRCRYINACIKFYSEWLRTGTLPDVEFVK